MNEKNIGRKRIEGKKKGPLRRRLHFRGIEE
jgi:hypothetical protein